MTLGLTVPGYTKMLPIYYLATVVRSKTDKMIAHFELFMYAYAILPALVGGSIGSLNNYFFSQIEQRWNTDPYRFFKRMQRTGWVS